MIAEWVGTINGYLWGSILIYLLTACGIWFSWRLRFIQIRHFKHMFTLLKLSRTTSEHGISSFQALCTSLAARVGTGNLMGVAVAISLGGAGAVFWMWVIAFVGMATAFAESLLGQLYKEQTADGNFRGGPAYYMKKGVKSPAMAFAFSLCLFFGYGFVFSSVQANSISQSFAGSFDIDPVVSGIVITLLAGLIIMGGLKAIAKFAEVIVPFMGLAYVIVTAVVLLQNLSALPDILLDIVSSALGLQQAGSGLIGAAIVQGVTRGLYSNEAGMGSAPNVAAAAQTTPNHPAAQGYIQMLAVFFDTIVICTCTALIILLFDSPEEGLTGIQLTQQALSFQVGAWGSVFISFAILFFGFTSIVANYAYAENNLKYLKLDSLFGHSLLKLGFLTTLFVGAISSLPTVIAVADLSTGMMTVINVSALFILWKVIVEVSKDYQQQLKTTQLPEFSLDKDKCQHFGLTDDVWQHKS